MEQNLLEKHEEQTVEKLAKWHWSYFVWGGVAVVFIGAIIAVRSTSVQFANDLGAIAIFIASINIFGGFIVTQRMLSMFKKKG